MALKIPGEYIGDLSSDIEIKSLRGVEDYKTTSPYNLPEFLQILQ
jgi:hypothetical protein